MLKPLEARASQRYIGISQRWVKYYGCYSHLLHIWVGCWNVWPMYHATLLLLMKQINFWLVVWNMFNFPFHIWDVILPIVTHSTFFRGVGSPHQAAEPSGGIPIIQKNLGMVHFLITRPGKHTNFAKWKMVSHGPNRNRWFTVPKKTWWCSKAMWNYQRVSHNYPWLFHDYINPHHPINPKNKLLYKQIDVIIYIYLPYTSINHRGPYQVSLKP